MFKCYKCECTTPLYRVNEKGVIGIWACLDHCPVPIDPKVKEITEIVKNQGGG